MPTKKCPSCGFEYDDSFSFCPKCGIASDQTGDAPKVSEQTPAQTASVQNVTPPPVSQNPPAYPNYVPQPQTPPEQPRMKCPKCGSTNLQIISDTHGKGAKFWKLCLCGIFGLCGTGKTKTDHYWVCMNCGHKFKL